MELTDASVTAILAHTPRTNKPNGGGGVYERNDHRSRVDAAVLHTCAANARPYFFFNLFACSLFFARSLSAKLEPEDFSAHP